MTTRLDLPVNFSANSEGFASFNLPQPKIQEIFSGNVTVANAPAGATFEAFRGGSSLGTWRGPQAFGPVQARGSEDISIRATGLQPSSDYLLNWNGERGVIGVDNIAPALPSTQSALSAPSSSNALIVNTVLDPLVGTFYYGPFDVSAYEALSVFGFDTQFSGANGGCEIVFHFCQEQPIFVPPSWQFPGVIARRTYHSKLDAVGNFCAPITDVIDVIAPWLIIEIIPNAQAAGASLGQSIVSGLPKKVSRSMMAGGILFAEQTFTIVPLQNIAAGASVSVQMPFIYPGPMQFAVRSNATNVAIEAHFTAIDANLVSHRIASIDGTVPNANKAFNMGIVHLPGMTTTISLINRSAALQGLQMAATLINNI